MQLNLSVIFLFTQTTIYRHPQLASVRVCEQNFLVTRYFGVSPPSVCRHLRCVATFGVSPQTNVEKFWRSFGVRF